MNQDLIGARLNNYEITEPLGRGGMAHVYKAWDTTLKRPAAVKVIDPGLSGDDRYRERFEREAQAVAALEHNHIVPVYYFGKTKNLYYLVMKFIEGEDLGTLMNRYAIAGEYLPIDDILRIIDGVASALDYAHRRGVIHRDIKPSNIMIDREGHPFITDFGLALDVNQGSIGDVLGTPHYVAPEQARNSANAIAQSDLYSLGVVLYELFTGVVPFDDPSPTAVALQHITKTPPAPRALNPELSPQIEAFILKAIAKNPEERFQSGKELAEGLHSAIRSTEQARNAVEIPALPPLPPGMQPPAPRRPSMRPVSAEVRASLAQRATFASQLNPSQVRPAGEAVRITAEHQAKQTIPAEPNSGSSTNFLPMLVLGGVIVAVVVVVAIVALTLNSNQRAVAIVPTATDEITPTIAPTNTSLAASPTPIEVITEEAIAAANIESSPTASPIPATNTPVPPTQTQLPPTSIPPSLTPAPSVTNTSIPPTSVPVAIGPTSPPADWLPVRFIYDGNAFYWMNDSGETISSEFITFEQMDGSKRFRGSSFSWYSMEPGRCMQIVFADVARVGCPENRRPNAYYTPTRGQGVDFWTGDTGQFRVLWNDTEIAVCDISAGQCDAAIPFAYG
jgi:serine/threonine protein kinase